MYTAQPHTYSLNDDFYGEQEEERDAVGLISGGTTNDRNNSSLIAARELYFPSSLMFKALTIKVEDAKLSEEADRRHILNFIAGKSLSEINNVPLKGHANYAAIDNALCATSVSTIPSIQSALHSGNDTIWSATLDAMTKGSNPISMHFEFKQEGWKGMTAEKAVSLIDHLPPPSRPCTLGMHTLESTLWIRCQVTSAPPPSWGIFI